MYNKSKTTQIDFNNERIFKGVYENNLIEGNLENLEDEILNSEFSCSNEEWKHLSLYLISVIRKNRNNNKKFTLCYMEIADIWESKEFTIPEQTIPFEVGIEMLKDDNIKEDRMIDNPNIENIEMVNELKIKNLENSKNYWKSLAEKRLIELQKEFEFRKEIVFNHMNSNYF